MPLRSFTQAELTLTERRRLEKPLLLTVWLSIACFCLAEQGFFYLVLASLAIGVNWWAASVGKEISVKRIFVNLGVAVATVVLLVEVSSAGAKEVYVLSHYLILIQLCKLFEQKRNRDYIQMLAISLMLLLASTLISDSLWLAVAAQAQLALTCYTSMVFILKRELDAAAGRRLFSEPAPLPVQRVAWNVLRNWPGKSLKKLMLPIFVTVLAAGVIVFLFLPRDLAAAPGFLTARRKLLAGMSGSVELGRPDRIYLSDEIVMRVRMTVAGKPVAALGPAAYLRGQTYDLYRDSKWSCSSAAAPGPEKRDLLVGDISSSDVLVQEVSMIPALLPKIFASYPAVRVVVPGGSVDMDAHRNYTVKLSSRPNFPVRYVAYSWKHPLSDSHLKALSALWRSWDDEIRAVRIPEQEISPRVVRLARDWCGELLELRRRAVAAAADAEAARLAKDHWDLEIARRLTMCLQRHCSYTLDLSEADPRRDGVEDFLFYMRKGHCEYFASALTLLCRSVGVRARLASGFLLGPPEAPGRFVVRARDAHAWTEIFTEGTGWIPIDPSPPASRVRPRGWWVSVKEFWQRLNFSWYERVAGYNEVARERFLGRLKAVMAVVGRGLSSVGRGLWQGFVNLAVHGYVDTAMFVFAVVVGLLSLSLEGVLVVRAIRRKFRSPWCGVDLGVPPWELTFVVRLFAVLQRLGLALEASQTARAAVREAAKRFDLPEQELRDVVELYYRIRWGKIRVETEEIRAAKELVARISKNSLREKRSTFAMDV